MNFNSSQREAIQHKDGPMLVLAGPGSGKTLVITQRTKYLIEECGVAPNNILVITFTKAAAVEMKTRFLKLMDETVCYTNFGTFHSIFFTILKYAYGYTSANILKEEKRQQYFREIIEKLDLEIEDENEFIQGVSGEISLIKGEMLDVEHYYSVNCSDEIFRDIYKKYEQKLRKGNLIDFDDMLVLCYELLVAREDILNVWQQKFKYILIDEFQDINKVQYDIVRLLAKKHENLFIVGDDDQSIYRFRGAKPEIMLNFKNDYPEAKQVVLNTNYRSTKNIVLAANRVIKNNKNRFPKVIETIHEKGKSVDIKTFKELKEQNQYVVELINNYRKKGFDYSDIAILFRTNTQPRALLEKVMEYNIPFKMRDSIPNIYEHWIAKNIKDYIHIACGNRERATFLQIINRPKRYISRECFDSPIVELDKIIQKYGDKDWMVDRINKLEFDLNLISKMDPYGAIHYIRNGVNYEEYLEEYAKFRRIKVEELKDILDEIEEAAKEFKTFQEWFDHINDYGEELKRQMKQNNAVDSVSMATMHSSKGLEYRVVILVDVNETITPHHKALLEEDLEEERRMFYVAMTRAKEHLHIFSVKERYNKQLQVSRFVGEILIDIEELKPGVRIEHKMLGLGTIKEKKEDALVVYFDRMKKLRTLDIPFCMNNGIIRVI